MVLAWVDIFRRPFDSSKHDFVSADARQISDPRTYEMLTSPPQAVFSPEKKTPDPLIRHVGSDPRAFSPSSQTDYFGGEAKYYSPSFSFSSPYPPCRSASAATRTESRRGIGIEWDPSSTYAPSSFNPAPHRTGYDPNYDRTGMI